FQEIKEKFQKTAQSWPEKDLQHKKLQLQAELEENREYIDKLKEMVYDYRNSISVLDNLLNRMDYYNLDSQKGEISNQLQNKVKQNPEEGVSEWVKDYREVQQKLDNLRQETEDDFYRFKQDVNQLIDDQVLKSKIKEKIISGFRSAHYKHNHESLLSLQEYLRNELNQLDEDKASAERARQQWAERSALHVVRLINSLQEMIDNMVYHNQNDYAFPLVKLRRTDLLPDDEEEVVLELKNYFVEIIEEFNQQEIEVENLTENELRDYIGDAALFSRAVRGRYPVLQVYKMSEKNEFLYAAPRDFHYADWEAVIQGKGDTPEGSGGQSLSINAFMMMMLLNYKKQRLDRENPWTVLFLDNPFGSASAPHVLDPIFKIADKLNFQLIAFAAPEIIKTETSERFPVFWALEISSEEGNQGTVTGEVIYGERVRGS
ncbi:MAG: hypothetical protein ACOC2O_02970, partial [Bacillota bacterium]